MADSLFSFRVPVLISNSLVLPFVLSHHHNAHASVQERHKMAPASRWLRVRRLHLVDYRSGQALLIVLARTAPDRPDRGSLLAAPLRARRSRQTPSSPLPKHYPLFSWEVAVSASGPCDGAPCTILPMLWMKRRISRRLFAAPGALPPTAKRLSTLVLPASLRVPVHRDSFAMVPCSPSPSQHRQRFCLRYSWEGYSPVVLGHLTAELRHFHIYREWQNV